MRPTRPAVDSEVQFHLGIDQAAADTEHAVAQHRGAEGSVEEAAAHGFQLLLAQFIRRGGRNDDVNTGVGIFENAKPGDCSGAR